MASIRDLHLQRKKMWDASIANHARYLDPSTQAFSVKFVENRSCPSCAVDKPETLFHKSGGSYVKCTSCSMVYTNPAFTDKALEEYYSSNHSVQSEIVASDIPFYRNLYEKGLDQIDTYLRSLHRVPRQKFILDIGCSAGGFLNIAKERGWRTFGLELNRTEREMCVRSGHQVQGSTLASANFAEKFSAITLWDVFEHIKDGYQLLKHAARVLSSDGTVFIQSPSADSIAARILQEKCNMFDGLEHVNIYGRKQLEILADRAGFEIVHFTTVIPEVGVINNYLSYEDPYLGGTDRVQDLWGLISAEDVMSRGLGYKFQALLKPR